MSTIRERLNLNNASTIRSRLGIQDTDTTSVSTYKRRFDYQKEQLNNIQKELTLAKRNVVNKNLLNQGIDTSKLGFGVSRKNTDLLKNNYTTMEDTSKKIMNEYQNAEKNSEIKELRQKRKEQESKTGYAEYDYNKKRVAEDEVTLFDKTLGRGINAIYDLVDTVNDPYVTYDSNGNRTYLDTYSQMKEQKVSENYDSKIGKFLGDAFYQVSKIGASTAGNLVAPGAGTALYWGNMYRNNLESAKKEGHGTGESMLYATAGTLLEFATGKVLGSATKSLTGGKTNEYNKALKGAVSKLIKNQTIQDFLANAGSEATEEFIQEFADRFLKNTILGEDNKVLSVDTLKDALYSAGIGAVSGGILGGKIETENVLNSENDLNNKSGVKNKPNVDQIVKPSTNTKSNENIAHTSSNVVQNLNKQEENVTERLEKIKQLQEVAKQNKKYDKINEVLEEYRNIQEKQNETIKNIENNQNNLIEQINSETQHPKYDLTIDEQNELRALKETDLAMGLDEKENTRLNYLEKKQNGLIKYPALIGKNSYENIKSNYWNYKNSLDSYNPALYNKIKEVTPSYRNTGRMTKNEWLGLAKNIGNNFKGDSRSLEKYAVQTWFYASPQNNLNKQGKKFVKFDIGEWLTSFYEGAGVGTEINIPTKSNTNAQVNYSMPNLPMSSYNYVESNNTKINELRKSASQYLNSSEKTIRTIDLMEKIIADKDYRIRFNPNITNESGVPVNGLITKENGQVTIELNPNANNYVEFLIVHEITHDIATKEMKELILDYAKQDSKFEKSLETLKERYQTDDVSDEVVADVCGELFGNREFIQSVVEKKPNIFMKILNNIRELAKKIKGSKAEEYVSFVEKLKTMWEDAYYSNESKLSESKFSIQQDSNGNNYVEVDTDQDIFDGIDEKDYNKIAKMYITDYLMGNTKLGNSDKVEINKKTSKKYTNPGKKQENFVEKMKLTPELKNVLEIATLRENSSANKINSKFANWEYYDFEFKLNGKTFKGNINIGITDKGKYLYEINNVKKTSGITGTSLHRPTGFSANNIPHSNNNVNSNTSSTTKYSMPISENNAQELDNSSFSFDNKGRKLTKAQQEYFKNSVVKDEKGNLKVVYHGTPFDFNKFSYDFVGANGTALGKGFYLTDSLSMAKGFSKEGKEPMQLYVNITNPMSLNEKTISKQQFKEYVKAVAKADEYYLYDYIDVDLVGFSNAINAAVDGQYEYSDNDVDLIHGVLNTSTLNWEEGFRILNKVLGYDGVIKHYDNGIDAAEGSSDVYVALFPEQIKNVDNTSPTSNEDIRYSQSTKEWNDYLKENFPSSGTKTKMSDIKLPVREDINKQNNKNNLSTKENPIKNTEELATILKEKPKTIEEKDNWLKKLATIKFIDKGYYVDKLARQTKNKELSSKYDYSLLANGIANQIIGNGRVDEKGNKVGKGLYEIFEPIENSGLLDEFSNYIYHKHNVDRMSLTSRFQEDNKAVFGESMTSEMSDKIVKDLEKKYPEFESWAKDIYEYNQANLKMLVKYDVISEDSIKYYNKKYPHYVPTIRHNDKPKIQMDMLLGKNAKVNSPIKKARGGNGDIIPLKDAMALRTMQTVNSALKNNFGLELLNTIATDVSTSTESVDTIVDEINADELLQKSDKKKPASMSVFLNGEKITFDISDEIYEALKPSNIYTSKVLNKLNNIRRGLLTEYNPTFMITNPLKDIQDGSINSKHPAKFTKNLVEATKQIKNKGMYYQLYTANGGSYETYFNYNTGTNIAPSKIDKIAPLKKISEANELIEMTPRLAEFISSIESGDSIETAMYNASEITTNFKRGGDITKTLDRNGVTFLNAGVQGAVKQIRNIQEARTEGIKGISKLAVRWTIAGLAPTLLMGMIWDDDEDYEELSDYIKNNYYILGKYDNGKFIRIPKGRVVSVLQNFFQNVINGASGKEIDLDGFIDLLNNNILPSDPSESSLIAPLKQAAKNETWYGGELVPTRLQNLPNAEQYDESTDSISIWLGEKLNISPYKINYVLDQYAGAIGDYTLPFLTQQAESGTDSVSGKLLAPIKDKFTADSVFKNQNVSDIYSLSEDLTKKSNSANATNEDIIKNKYINSIKSEMSDLYAEKRKIQNSSQKDSVKFNKSREIQNQINELAKTGLNNYENVDLSDNYAVVGDREYYLNKNEEWTKVDKTSTKYKTASLLSGYKDYLKYNNEINNIKDTYKSVSNRKNAVIKYINSLNLSVPQKAILIKMNYSSFDTYNTQVINYVNTSNNTMEDKRKILKSLGFEVYTKNGKTYVK